MKTIFEPSDLVGDKQPFILGRIVRRGPKDEHYIIGYDPAKDDNDGRYHLTSTRDGMLVGYYSSETMCKFLTEGGFEIVGTFTRVEDLLS